MTKNKGKFFLERTLSKLGLASRSQTRRWILDGRLKVNGKTVKDPLYPVNPGIDKITLDGKKVNRKSRKTILLYKPGSVVTTRSDERGRRTVFDLLPDELRSLHPVGRLDMATTGLLLLTNDTRFSAYLTDPVNAVRRTYAVSVRGKVTGEEIQKLMRGILDRGEVLKPLTLTLRKSSNKESHLMVELTEGKNREIRRMFESIGHEVTRLKRVAFGSLTLGNMQPGQFRYLTSEEMTKSCRMKTKHWLCMIVMVVALAAAMPSDAAELKGIDFPDHIHLDGVELVLNGLGLRQATAFKVNVYIAGLYLTGRSGDPQAILQSPAPKRLVLHFLRSVDSDELAKAWDEGFEKNAASQIPALKDRIEKIKGFTKDMKTGQRLIFTYKPGLGIEVGIDDILMGTVEGDDFSRAFLSIWLGPNPPNKDLKDGLLGTVSH